MSLSPSVYPLLENARYYVPLRIESRPGQVVVNSSALTDLIIHSMKRLNDDLVGAALPWSRIIGAGPNLYSGQTAFTLRDAGYSGNPLAFVPFRPDQSPESWLYIGDSSRMRKIRTDGTNYQMGIAPPVTPPEIALGVPQFAVLEPFTTTPVVLWVNGGTAGAIAKNDRINTTISDLKYDVGTTGWASIKPATMDESIQAGAIVTVNGAGGTAETVRIQSVFRGITSTTIGSIAYDNGTTGLCTIQPAILAAGETRKRALPDAIQSDPFARNLTNSRTPNAVQTETSVTVRDPKFVGLEPGVLLRLNNGGGNQETVIVLSTAWNKDGTASLRCYTTGTHVAAETLATYPTFRAYLANTHAATETLTAGMYTSAVTAGVGYLTKTATFDLSVIGSRPAQDDDEIHLSVSMADYSALIEGRIMFDVDVGTNDFTQNFYYGTFRASDLVPIVSGALTTTVGTQSAIQNTQITGTTQPGDIWHSPNPTGNWNPGTGFTNIPGYNPYSQSYPYNQTPATTQNSQTPITGPGVSITGNYQWTELVFKVRDLQRVGSDNSRNLSNVKAIRIYFNLSTGSTVNVAALTIQGAYGPDVGVTGGDYFYRYRGRSSETGAKSNPSPATRYGLRPHRQRILVNVAPHGDPQVDKLDIYRYGGAITQWLYVGTTSNSTSVLSSAKLPTSGVDGGGGFVAWTNPGNITLSDGSYASTGVSSFPPLNDVSDFLVATAYGFAIPAGSTILGVLATVRGKGSGTATTRAYLVKAGTVQTGFYFEKPVSNYGAINTDVNYGSSSNLWQADLSVADVNAAGFGVALQLLSPHISGGWQVDSVTITVFYGSGVQFADEYADDGIANAPILEFDNFQPFPTTDIPRRGICNVVGNRVTRVSGDVFNAEWAPGSIIEIGGVPQILYAQPYSTSLLETQEGMGTQSNVAFLVRGATIQATPLPSLWGPMEGMLFACGDTYQPGTLFITKPNDPDSAPDRYQIDVTPPSEPLINGCMYGTRAFVWSSERMWEIIPSFADTNIVRVQEVPDGGGMFCRWGLAVGSAMYSIQKEGIFASLGGSRQSITERQLYLLFPHDGQAGQNLSVGGATFYAPDMTQTSDLRLRCYDRHLYFDYVDLSAARRTLVFNEILGVWGVDEYANPAVTHYGEEGFGVHSMLIGSTNGKVYQLSGTQDDGVDFAGQYYMPLVGDLDAFLHAANAQIALMSNDAAMLIANVDGVDYSVLVPSTAGVYKKQYVNMQPVKGKAWAFGITSTKPFKLFARDCFFQMRAWGEPTAYQQYNPFADYERNLR